MEPKMFIVHCVFVHEDQQQQHSNWPGSALALPRLPEMEESVNDGCASSVQVAVLRLEVPIDKWEGVP